MGSANERNANELLGFGVDARLLVVNCDDLGMYRAVNLGIIEAVTIGVATTCSLMTPCPAASHAIELLRERPQIPFGIHLTVVCDLPGHRWGPLAPKEKVRSLLAGDGQLFGLRRLDQLMAQARLDELELEFRTQIETVLTAKLEPTHLDWHCFRDGGRDDVFELGVALAREYGLALRTSDRGAQQRLKSDGLPATDHPLVDSFSLEIDDKSTRYAELLRTLPPGLSQWAVHPALADDEAKRLDPGGWRVRRTDYEFLLSRQAHEIIARESIVLLDYVGLQQVWRRTRRPPAPIPEP
jgi:chitin disaccharide deacetylase